MNQQSRFGSLVEACSNVAVGFFVSLAVWVFVVVPLWGIPVTVADNLAITGVFTITSILRSYIIRRFFAGKTWWRKS